MNVVNFVQTFGKAQYCFNTRKIGFCSRTLDSFNIWERFSKTWKIWLQVNGFIVTGVQEMQQGGNSMLLNLHDMLSVFEKTLDMFENMVVNARALILKNVFSWMFSVVSPVSIYSYE